MDYIYECCKELSVDEIEQAILASDKAGSVPDARALASFLKLRAG